MAICLKGMQLADFWTDFRAPSTITAIEFAGWPAIFARGEACLIFRQRENG
jgi:hypothetical protein